MSHSDAQPRPLRIGLFGAGSRGGQCLAALADDARFNVVCFFDNDPKKWGTMLHDRPIQEPTRAACEDLDAIVIASLYASEILVQLARLGCSSKIALSPTDLVRRRMDQAPADVRRGDQPETVRASIMAAVPAHLPALADRIDVDPPPPADASWTDEAACTICCNNYFAYAIVLARSFLRHHPGGRFYIGLADTRRPEVPYPDDPRIRVIEARELDIPRFQSFAFKYDILELNTAIKPFLLEHLFRIEGARRLLYLDPDILVLAPLSPLFEQLARTPLVLTPHLTRPYDDDRQPSELDIMRSGTFNLGFAGLAAHAQTWTLLHWWQQRLYDGCTREVEKGLFVDQKWMDLVPSFFPDHTIERAPGYNVAYWNLHERQVTREDDRFLVNGETLRFFHFSGVDVGDLDSVSKYQNRFTLPDTGGLRDLFELYRLLLIRHRHLDLRGIAYAYGEFENGVRIPDLVRRIYRDAALSVAYPDPFETHSPHNFFAWLRQPSRPGVMVSNLYATMHARMPELRAAFPDLYGVGQLGFLLHMMAAVELHGLPAELTELQTSAIARAVSIPSAVHVIVSDRSHDRMHRALASALAAAEVTVDLQVGATASTMAANDAAVGYWLWNERWPRALVEQQLAQLPLREIWVPGAYALEGLSRIVSLPVVPVPPPVGVITPSARSRSAFGLDPARFLITCLIDEVTATEAADDGPAEVRAFLRAIASERLDVRTAPQLCLIADGLSTAARVAFDRLAATTPAIKIIDAPRDIADVVQLLRLSDLYVSLRQPAALDLWSAYAQWHGTPALVSAWGGNLDSITINNGYLVDLTAGLDDAVRQMQRSWSFPDEHRRLGQRARADARSRYALSVVREIVARRARLMGVGLDGVTVEAMSATVPADR